MTMNDFEDKLIECVQDFPILYKCKNKNYKYTSIKEQAWRDIGTLINKDPDQCKRKWKTIRDNYRKYNMKKKAGTLVGLSKYNDERLSFLDDIVEEEYNIESLLHPETAANQEITIDDTMDETENAITDHFSPYVTIEEDVTSHTDLDQSRKRPRRSYQIEEMTSQTHSFFQCMADIVSQFPPRRIAEVRMKVCNIVSQMELQVLAEACRREPSDSNTEGDTILKTEKQ